MKPSSELLEKSRFPMKVYSADGGIRILYSFKNAVKSMAILYEVQDAPGEGLRECCFVKVIICHNSLINDCVLIFHLQLMTIQSIPSILIDQMCVVL